jgi:hydrogenase expression/formation protein HypE
MEISNSIQSDCANLGPMVRTILQSGAGVRLMRDITRGGLGTIVNEIAEAKKVSIEIEENNIPIDPEVKSFCEILGLDPLYMANEGKFLCIVSQADEGRVLDILRSHDLGRNAGIIGRVQKTDDTLVTVRTRLGGRRIIDILYGEGLPRIC